MAEGIARQILVGHEIQSAGSEPKFVHPLAKTALAEIGISLDAHSSKRWEDLSPSFQQNLDLIITLCAEEVCPVAISKAKRLHWPLRDPASPELASDPEKALNSFRETRDQLKKNCSSSSQHFIKHFKCQIS